jgi:SAM-dependent methyltransferase
MEFEKIFYPESRFGGFTDIDGTVVFYSRVQSLVSPESVVLDIGCGRGAYRYETVPLRRELRIFKGKAKRVLGLDVDQAAADNPYLDEFCLLKAGQPWPVSDNSIDLIVCDSVLEHVDDPVDIFGQVRRVLKDGGFLCLRTTNAWSYVGIAARLVPNRSHARLLSKVQPIRQEEDVFPTRYRCNTVGKLRAMMDRYDFDHVVYSYEAEPSYLSFSRLAYWFGVIHQRFAPRIIKPAIFAFGKLRKKAV